MPSKIDIACEWAIATANNPEHGYDNVDRQGPDYDCASFVQNAWRAAGVEIAAPGSASFHTFAIQAGFVDVTANVNTETGEGARKGDILVVHREHVAMVVDDNLNIAEALGNENGESTGGQTGDQTGREILVQSWRQNNPPWEYVVRWPELSADKSSVTVSNTYINETQMKNNALYVAAYMLARGWTLNAISGMLGNMQHESRVNSGIWQNLREGNLNGGLGLVQWTPATVLINWATENGYENYLDIDCQLNRILYEVENSIQYFASDTYPTPATFAEFTTSTLSPYQLACSFAWNYERSWTVLYGTEIEKLALREQRGGAAESWFTFLSGFDFSGSVINNNKGKLSRILFLALASE